MAFSKELNKRNGDDEMDDDSSVHSVQSVTSLHSVSSAVSNGTAASLQDVELGRTGQQEVPNSTKKKKNRQDWQRVRNSRCFKSIVSAHEQFTSSNFHGMNPALMSILMTEAAERFAYYGFRAILVLYFTQELKMDDAAAISLFAFASYVANFTPICGAILGDSKFGRFKTIVAFGFVYWLGLIVLTHAAFLRNYTASQLKVKRIVTMVGLALICAGTGGIKPCVSIFGADQVTAKKSEEDSDYVNEKSTSQKHDFSSGNTSATMDTEQQKKVRTFFSFFSMCINLGAVASFVIIPTVKASFGFGAAFLVPTVFMCLAIIVFTSQRDNYVYRPYNPHGSSLFTTFRLCVWLLHNNLWDNKFIAEHFPQLEPGPVPLPSVLPRNDHVQGMNVPMGGDRAEPDDNTSMSSMSMSFRSLSRSVERRLSRSVERSRSRSFSRSSRVSASPDTRVTIDTSKMPADHPLRARGNRNNLGSGLEVPSRSPSLSTSRSRSRRRRERSARKGRSTSRPGTPSMSGASLHTSDRYLAQQLSDAARALNVLPIFAMLPCFWMLYDQQGSVWTLQASRMNLYGIIQPEQVNVLNPIGLFLLIPVFDKAIYPALQKREIDISPLRRMGWGMIMVSFAFYISGIVEYVIDYRIQNGLSQISVLWQIPQIALMTVAEIFISVTGLEFAYSVSPDRLKSFVMAAYLMTIAKGDFWGGVLYSTIFRDMNQAVVLHIFAFAMMSNLAFYGYVVQSWELRHGVVSWELFDRVLETESKHRPCWKSHQRQYLISMGESTPAPRLEMEKEPPNDQASASGRSDRSGKSHRSGKSGSSSESRRGRGRWRKRDKYDKKKKGRSKSRKSSKKESGSSRRRKSSTKTLDASSPS